jgi:hypothetical protein
LSFWQNDGGFASRQRADKAAECVVFDAENAGDVFPNDDALWLSAMASNIVDCISELHEREGEVSACIGKRSAKTGDTECLARRAADQYVWRCYIASADGGGDKRHIAKVRHVGVVVREYV